MRLFRSFSRLIACIMTLVIAGFPFAAQAAPPEEITAKVALGLEMSVVPTPVTEALEAALDATALAQWFCDPETCRVILNYRTAAKPLVPVTAPVTVAGLKAGFTGPVSAVTASNFSAVLRAELLIAADELAIRETLHRRFTAQNNKNESATALQNATLASLVKKTAADKTAANGAWSRLATHLKAAGIDSKPGGAAKTLATIKERGFPPGEMALFKGLGLSAPDIDQLHKVVLKYADPAKTPKSFAAAISGIMKINTSNTTMQSCKCAPPH